MSQPPDRNDSANLFDPFGLWKQSQLAMLESWSKTMADAVNTDAYAESTGRMLDAYLTTAAPLRKVVDQTMTQLLSQLSLPSRAEVLSLAERMTNIELRLDDLDAQLDVIHRDVERMANAVAALSAITAASTSANGGGETQTATRARNRAAASGRGTETGARTTTRTTRTSTARARRKTE
jgi:hypothetical protein